LDGTFIFFFDLVSFQFLTVYLFAKTVVSPFRSRRGVFLLFDPASHGADAKKYIFPRTCERPS
jgi:hypothetical protein